MNRTTYLVELEIGKKELALTHPDASEMLRKIERATADGWAVRRILRNYVDISHGALEHDAEREGEASPLARPRPVSRPGSYGGGLNGVKVSGWMHDGITAGEQQK